MASAAPAYRTRQQSSSRSNVRVVRGQAQEELPFQVIVIARMLALLVVVLALVGCVRIGLTAATVDTALAAENLAEQVSDLQSYGASLEVRESSLSSPSYVRGVAAGELGMSAPETADVMRLDGEMVAVDSSGNLSLSQSLANLSQE